MTLSWLWLFRDAVDSIHAIDFTIVSYYLYWLGSSQERKIAGGGGTKRLSQCIFDFFMSAFRAQCFNLLSKIKINFNEELLISFESQLHAYKTRAAMAFVVGSAHILCVTIKTVTHSEAKSRVQKRSGDI